MSVASRRFPPATQTALDAARHICQEARVVLTSLRGGPPIVARGELAQDLMDLRIIVRDQLDKGAVSRDIQDHETKDAAAATSKLGQPDPVISFTTPPAAPVEDDDSAVLVEHPGAHRPTLPHESPLPKSRICNFTPTEPQLKEIGSSSLARSFLGMPDHVGIYARPFLAVVVDPRAAGPHTLVALRALFRLLERGSLLEPTTSRDKHDYHVALEPLMKGVLACKFEQTDAGADEAVEMAIADLLALLVTLNREAFLPTTLMDAFNTVFVTRNTFVHSPALCYHFEDVLSSMVVSVFENIAVTTSEEAGRLILEFLVNQLLHTPLMGGESLDDAAREAQVAHDATRVLCLRLTRCCLQSGWGNAADQELAGNCAEDLPIMPTLDERNRAEAREAAALPTSDRPLLRIIQDDLCLSLLMTGQAIWAYHDSTTNISPGFISLEVLSEICATMSTLWSTMSLRLHLVEQFERIFTGFFQRALVLLRKRANADDPISYNANLAFDSEVEIIIESLVDLLCLHEPSAPKSAKHKSALDTLFATYDCSLSHADVSTGLIVELCRCCGGIVDNDGEAVLGRPVALARESPDDLRDSTAPAVSGQSSRGSISRSDSVPIASLREVPAHLKELCAEALSGSIKCLFHEGHPSMGAQSLATVPEGSCPVSQIENSTKDDRPRELDSPYQEERMRAQFAAGSVSLRYIKSQKQLLRGAAKLFNMKASRGIDFLLSSGLIPNPVTPASVAGFLRNGLVVGLDKAAVGSYLGEIGKAPAAGKSPAIWERDWFHKEVLEAYCTLFRFEGQTLLDGLRMFLAAFRLPGEGQQIDRIIQAFAESCGRICDESARLKLFSEDPKRASDPAFLLAYSIIMLNTDLHNRNIREDRKMSLEAFIRNNTDYGRDITERGKELPRDFLVSIYESIRDEEIRTEGEGAEGHMTIERWKDVLRGSTEETDSTTTSFHRNRDDPDLKEVILETLWQPILSTIGAFWGAIGCDVRGPDSSTLESSHNMMLGAQGARLGMDMAIDILEGVRNMNRIDIFQQVFKHICRYSGLLDCQSDAVDRTWAFINSVEAQSAVVVAIKMAREAGDDLGPDGWKRVWGIIFELRDLKLLCGGFRRRQESILVESDPDLLTAGSRREWNMWLVKGDIDSEAELARSTQKGSTSLFGALFGSKEEKPGNSRSRRSELEPTGGSIPRNAMFGKEEYVLWDELAPSDDEEDDSPHDPQAVGLSEVDIEPDISTGMAFESQLIQEDILLQQQADTSVPVTGLERVEDTRRFHISPRARVRKRLQLACDFAGLVADSRFMDEHGFASLLSALVGLVAESTRAPDAHTEEGASHHVASSVVNERKEEESDRSNLSIHLSPASEAFAEILIAEVAIKNRDRLESTWLSVLRTHYETRLDGQPSPAVTTDARSRKAPDKGTAGLEKCATGLLRICACAVTRETMADDITSSLSLLYPSGSHPGPRGCDHLDRHLGEGLWRISRNVDELRTLSQGGWESLLGLAAWCASVGDRALPVLVDRDGRSAGLADDNPALQAYRSLHVILHAPELIDTVPFSIIRGVRALIATGERANFPKMSIAGLDMILVLRSKIESKENPVQEDDHTFWVKSWMPLLEGIAEAAKDSQYSGVRQHAISMLTDAFIDKQGRLVPPYHFCQAMTRVCIPLAGTRIAEMLRNEIAMVENVEEVMIEFELCISLLFKPLLHHLKSVLVKESEFLVVWSALLKVLEDFLVDGSSQEGDTRDRGLSPEKLRHTTRQLASEHLRNAVMVLSASGVLAGAPDESSENISSVTWDSIAKMTFCKDETEEWKQAASTTNISN